MKKLIFLLSIFTLSVAAALDASARYKGDLNGDDRVNLSDMVYLAKAIKAGSTDKALDVNASGKVDDYDLHRLADIVISGKLVEDTGMNVGIGGWDDDGEDYGGAVKAPAFTTRSADETRFFMRSPKSEGDDRYSMEFGISEGTEAPSVILFNIRLPQELKLDASKNVELDPAIASSHNLYGTPKFIKENENDEWSDCCLRFVLMSPDLNALPFPTGKLGKIIYSVNGDFWSSPFFVNCQVASAGEGNCTDVPEHESDYYGNFIPVEVTSVLLNYSEMNLSEGDCGWLSASIDPWEATDKSLVWVSSEESVASLEISESGQEATVNALKAGQTTITATSSNGISASCVVTVSAKVIDVISVTLDKTSLEMTEGDTAQLTASVTPDNATDKTLTWTSSDTSVATVSANGEVKAVTPGTATISVAASNGLTASCTVTVEKRIVEVNGIVLSTSALKLTEGESATLAAIIQPADATDKSISWTSSDASVASVSANGEVKAIKAGTAVITATAANGISASCNVTVVSGVVSVSEVILDKTSLEMTEGDSARLTATVNPDNATDKTLTWTSSDASVASVSANGEITAVKAGTATIIVSSSNGKTASCTVNVAAKEIEMQSIVLDAESLDLEIGDSHQFVATIYPAETIHRELEWWIEDETVASIDDNGFVIMLSEGSTIVHVRSVRWNHVEASCRLNVSAAVEGMIVDDAPCDIYNANGLLLKRGVPPSELQSLSKGLYIIRQGGQTTKLLK